MRRGRQGGGSPIKKMEENEGGCKGKKGKQHVYQKIVCVCVVGGGRDEKKR